MRRLASFIKWTLIGGVTVLLPVAIIFGLMSWVFGFLIKFVAPFSKIFIATFGFGKLAANGIVLGGLVGFCFFCGLFVRFRVGVWIIDKIERLFLMRIPGYNLVKETVQQFLGAKQSPFARVAAVKLFGNDTKMTAFITDEHPDGMVTVFVPTGPNPTSGNIYHLNPENVTPLDISVDTVMKSIIGCGVGSKEVLEKKVK